MTRRRWIADEVSGSRAFLLGNHADHLARVLRAQLGQEFDVVAEGRVHQGRVAAIEAGRVEFELGADIATSVVATVTVGISIFKFDRMEWAIEKAAELGVTRIVPLISRRTEKRLAEAAGKRGERWRRIAQQASEQSRRSAAPEVAFPVKLKEFIGAQKGLRIVLSEAEQESRLKDCLKPYAPGEQVVLAFGPEGGWTEEELEMFQSAEWSAATMGQTILRAETAVIAGLAVAVAELR